MIKKLLSSIIASLFNPYPIKRGSAMVKDAAPTLSVADVVDVQIVLSTTPAQAQNLSDMLVLTDDDVISIAERYRVYTSLAGVAADFGTDSVAYAAAQPYFAQLPQPQEIQIGRWAKEATAAQLFGGTLSSAQQAIALWNAVTTPGFFLRMNGLPYAIAPASFATATNLNGIATLIQTALNAAVAGTTCVWDAEERNFIITSGSTGVTSTFSFAEAPTAVGKLTFTLNPSPAATITLNGTAWTFVAALTTGNQILIGADLATTLQTAVTTLGASMDVQTAKFEYAANATILYLNAAAPGAGGNALTLAASVATPSGGTLAGGSATDISTMLDMTDTDGDGAFVSDGIAAETALAAVELFDQNYGQKWYSIEVPEAADADQIACAEYIEASSNKHLYAITTQEAGTLSSVSTTDLAYELHLLGLKRTTIQFSSSNGYAISSYMGRAINVNYTGSNTVITMKFKQEPGIAGENLTESQAQTLAAKGCNVFAIYNNNTSIVQQGIQSDGVTFTDIMTFVDWFAVTLQAALYNVLITTNTKVPQTNQGMHLLTNAATAVCQQGVVNGGLAPGVWQVNGFGTLKTGDYLETGYYVFIPSVDTQNQADRAARKAPLMQIALKLAGAVHSVSVIATVDQ